MKRLLAVMTAGLLMAVAVPDVSYARGGRGGGQSGQGQQSGPKDGSGQKQGQSHKKGKKGKRSGPQDGSGPIHNPPQTPPDQK